MYYHQNYLELLSDEVCCII